MLTQRQHHFCCKVFGSTFDSTLEVNFQESKQMTCFSLSVWPWQPAPGTSWRGTETTWCISWSSLSELCWGPCWAKWLLNADVEWGELVIGIVFGPYYLWFWWQWYQYLGLFRLDLLTVEQWRVLDYWDAGTSKKQRSKNWAYQQQELKPSSSSKGEGYNHRKCG